MPHSIAIKDQNREVRIYGARTVLAILIVLGLLSIVLMRYFSLQITEYEVYKVQSERNRVQLQSLPPKRGLIFDRNGVLLADNRPSYVLSIVSERIEDLEATLTEIQTLLPISEFDLDNFRKKTEMESGLRSRTTAFSPDRRRARAPRCQPLSYAWCGCGRPLVTALHPR